MVFQHVMIVGMCQSRNPHLQGLHMGFLFWVCLTTCNFLSQRLILELTYVLTIVLSVVLSIVLFFFKFSVFSVFWLYTNDVSMDNMMVGMKSNTHVHTHVISPNTKMLTTLWWLWVWVPASAPASTMTSATRLSGVLGTRLQGVLGTTSSLFLSGNKSGSGTPTNERWNVYSMANT